MKFNLNSVNAAEEGRSMTAPGTIAVFTIETIEFKEKENGKEYFEVTFGRKEDSFREYFYMTEKAAERFVYLWQKVMGEVAIPESEVGIIAGLKDKQVALKVIGSINVRTGKGYPGLPYTGFARPVAQIDELFLTNSDKTKVAAIIEAQTQSANASNGASTQVAEVAADDKF
jgi:hypothetical protein